MIGDGSNGGSGFVMAGAMASGVAKGNRLTDVAASTVTSASLQEQERN